MSDSDQQTIFHTIASEYNPKETSQQKPFELSGISLVATQQQKVNTKDNQNSPTLTNLRNSNNELFQTLINDITNDKHAYTIQQTFYNNFEMFRRKERMTIERQQKKFVAQSKWITKNQIRCLIQYNNMAYQTVCKIHKGLIEFNNAMIKISVYDIIKIKVCYKSFNKYLILTCIDLLNKKYVENKCLISIQNDVKDDLYDLMTKIITEKLRSINIQIQKGGKQAEKVCRFEISGDLYKKSQILGNWGLRKIVITDFIQSYKDDKCTYSIKNIKQIWTRFQTYENGLIFKIRHGSQKTEIAIPIVNYNIKYSTNNWFCHFYRLLSSTIM